MSSSLAPAQSTLDFEVRLLPQDRYVYAIGDIHGDLAILKKLINATGVVDANGRWMKPDSLLVLTGDYVDRGPDTYAVLNYLIDLQNKNPDRLHVLMGNHERMRLYGELKYAPPNEGPNPNELFLREPYATFLRKMPIFKKIGPHVFVHGGIEPDAIAAARGPGGLTRFNEVAAQNVEVFQKILREQRDLFAIQNVEERIMATLARAPEPRAGEFEKYLMSGISPLWTRLLAETRDAKREVRPSMVGPSNGPTLEQMLMEFLRVVRAERLVLGHTVQYDPTNMSASYQYGDRLSLIDVGNSAYYAARSPVAAFVRFELARNVAMTIEVDRVTGQARPRNEYADRLHREWRNAFEGVLDGFPESPIPFNRMYSRLEKRGNHSMINVVTGEGRDFQREDSPYMHPRMLREAQDETGETIAYSCFSNRHHVQSFGRLHDRPEFPTVVQRSGVGVVFRKAPRDAPERAAFTESFVTLRQVMHVCPPSGPCEAERLFTSYETNRDWTGLKLPNLGFFRSSTAGTISENYLRDPAMADFNFNVPSVHRNDYYEMISIPAANGQPRRLKVRFSGRDHPKLRLYEGNGWQFAIRNEYELECFTNEEYRGLTLPAKERIPL